MLIETPAGLLDKATPEDRIRAETEEETGYKLANVERVFEAFMSPGSVTERLFFFIAAYTRNHRIGLGGHNEHEGEDIEVLEMDVDDALNAIRHGKIQDGKTIMLLQYAALHVFAQKGLLQNAQ